MCSDNFLSVSFASARLNISDVFPRFLVRKEIETFTTVGKYMCVIISVLAACGLFPEISLFR